MKIKAIYKKNLKMPEGKVAAQIAHAVKNLGITPRDSDIVVLRVSDKKFDELVAEHPDCYVQVDKGLTVVEKGTATAAAWIDKTQIIKLPYDELISEMYGLYEDVDFEYEGKKYRFLYDRYAEHREEYGIENVHEISGIFKTMLDNGLYKKLN